MQNESPKPDFKRAHCQQVNKQAESCQLLDRRFDEMDEAEAHGIMRALFGRAESLTSMMLK
jgi:hypothetical protein